MKHTLGPWVNVDMRKWNGASAFYIKAPNGPDKRSPNVALIPNSAVHDSKANAKLIASAPVMLDRLTLIENLATQVCDAINKRDAIAYEETLSSIKMLAREAIVEATDRGYHSFNQRGNSV